MDEINTADLNLSIFSNNTNRRAKFNGSNAVSNTKAIRIRVKEIEDVLNYLNNNRQQFFKSMNEEVKDNCDKLIKLISVVSDDNTKDIILGLYEKIFDPEELLIPGTVGSYIDNCINNFKEREFKVENVNVKNIEEIRKYEDCNFLFYINNLFTPIRLDSKNNRTIIIINEDEAESFKLSIDDKNILKNMGIGYDMPIQVMSYCPRNRTLKQVFSTDSSKFEIEIRRNNLLIGTVTVLFLIAIVVIFFISVNKDMKKKKK